MNNNKIMQALFLYNMANKLFIALITIFISYNALYAQPIIVESKSYSIPQNWLGLNGRSTEGPSWDNLSFLSLVKELSPSYVRYPAGTQANYWDWHTGTFIEGCGKSSPYKFTIKSCINGIDNNAKIIYVINMARPTPSTGFSLFETSEILASEAVLNAKIDDIQGALKEFERYNKLPEVIEFGNEFYFSNEHGSIYAANPALYINHSKKIAKAIKMNYPKIKLILCTTKGGSKGRDAWNNSIFEALNSDSEIKSLISGVTQHHYIGTEYGNSEKITTPELATEAIAEAYNYKNILDDNCEIIPQGFTSWITEFGVTKKNSIGSWASGLRSAALIMTFMNSHDKIANLSYHHITDDPYIINKTEMKLGPSGIVFSLLANAVNNKNTLQNLIFSNNSIVYNDNVLALYGYKFSNESTSSFIILNMSGNNYDSLNLTNLFRTNSEIQTMQYWSPTPEQENVYKDYGIKYSHNQDIKSFNIPGFSITYINESLQTSVIQNMDNIKWILKNQNMQLECRVNNNNNSVILIYDTMGKLVLEKAAKEEETIISLSSLSKGTYFAKLISSKGQSVFNFLIK